MQIDLKTGISILSMVVAAVSAGYAFMTTTNAGIQDLKGRITEIEAKIPDNFTPGLSKAQVQTLVDSASRGLSESQVKSLINAALQAQSETVHSIPSDAVVAFARECPEEEGWFEYEHGYGRIIVGAGKPNAKQYQTSSYPFWQPSHLPSSTDNRKKLTTYEPEEAGGEEAVTLSVGQMPSHDHWPEFRSEKVQGLWVTYPKPGDGEEDYDFGRGGDRTKYTLAAVEPKSEGGINDETQSHNNMPPYVALYFCKKD
ncbi:hypothetical protein [Labrenzia sp. DG1229]|uniref:hypothetical protein n=1 Tax=Labrenzia sp. DG1229 TaxID=681847 RepID=UPI00049132B1|nr:hypothetical protein [Labrenzia sp. DG1229]